MPGKKTRIFILSWMLIVGVPVSAHSYFPFIDMVNVETISGNPKVTSILKRYKGNYDEGLRFALADEEESILSKNTPWTTLRDSVYRPDDVATDLLLMPYIISHHGCSSHIYDARDLLSIYFLLRYKETRDPQLIKELEEVADEDLMMQRIDGHLFTVVSNLRLDKYINSVLGGTAEEVDWAQFIPDLVEANDRGK